MLCAFVTVAIAVIVVCVSSETIAALTTTVVDIGQRMFVLCIVVPIIAALSACRICAMSAMMGVM